MQTEIQASKLKEKFLPFSKKMVDEGLPPLIIDTFKFYYEKLLKGERGLITKKDIVPVKKDEEQAWDYQRPNPL